MNGKEPSFLILGLGALDLTRENVRDLKQAFPRYCPLAYKAVVGTAVLALGTVVVVMDLARWNPLRAWWYGDLAHRGDELQRQIRQAAALQRAQAPRKERGHDPARRPLVAGGRR